MSVSDTGQIEQWIKVLTDGVINSGSLVIKYPVHAIATEPVEEIALQRERFAKVFSEIITQSNKALIFGLGKQVPGTTEAQQSLSRLLSCGKHSCEILRDLKLLSEFKDFFIDCSRTYSASKVYVSEYPSYEELICSFLSPVNMSLDWVKDVSLWDLGSLKQPYKGVSSGAKRFIQESINEGQVIISISLSYAGTYVAFHLPVEHRERFVRRILELDLER